MAIEFAFVAAVFLTILFAIMTYGFHFATRIALSHAVSEGGRAAVAGLNDADREELARNAIRNAIEAYGPLVRWEDTETIDPNWRNTDTGRIGDIGVIYNAAGRFAFLPFVPAPDDMIRVSTTYIVTDPDG